MPTHGNSSGMYATKPSNQRDGLPTAINDRVTLKLLVSEMKRKRLRKLPADSRRKNKRYA